MSALVTPSLVPVPFLLREATPADAPQVLGLARLLDSINLPIEEDEAHALVACSGRSFRGAISTREEGRYLFVLEEQETQRLVGASMIIAKHGTPDSPHFYLEMATDQRYSKSLKQMFRHTYLTLRRNIDGPTEIGGLIVDPTFRQHPAKVGKQLSFVRFLYLAMYPERFEDEVIAEMMPPLTSTKDSLFWECYGKRVTGMSFREADRRSTKDKEFIEALFPSIPIYVCMLPVDVQEQIATVGPEARGAAALLEKIGLRFLRHVDPFDGGPYYGAKVQDVVLVRQFRWLHVVVARSDRDAETQHAFMIGWEGEAGFRAASIRAQAEESFLFCTPDVLAALGLSEGVAVGVIPLL